MNKTTAIGAVLAAVGHDPMVVTTGYACRIARHLGDRPGLFYMTGSMGLAAPIGAGVALQTGRRTVIIDGDGAVLMNPGGLLLAAALTDRPLPLVHVVLDDGRYASTGAQPVPGSRVDLCGLARASGYPESIEVNRSADLDAALAAPGGHPVFVHCLIADEDQEVPPRIDTPLPEVAARFTTALGGAARG